MNLETIGGTLPAITPESLEKVLALEAKVMEHEIQFPVEHLLHAGMYSRTVRLFPGALIIGTLVKIPTTIVVHGRCQIFADKWHMIEDFQVIPAGAGRKQVFIALDATEITMIFPTQAKTVEEAEAEFTDETAKLQSRRHGEQDIVRVTA